MRDIPLKDRRHSFTVATKYLGTKKLEVFIEETGGCITGFISV
jgi:hypothetical protein